MKFKQICIFALILTGVIYVAFASEKGTTLFTKGDVKQTKHLDPSTADVNISFENAKTS